MKQLTLLVSLCLAMFLCACASKTYNHTFKIDDPNGVTLFVLLTDDKGHSRRLEEGELTLPEGTYFIHIFSSKYGELRHRVVLDSNLAITWKPETNSLFLDSHRFLLTP